MDCSTTGFPVLHQFLELAQTHVHCIGDAIQPSHPQFKRINSIGFFFLCIVHLGRLSCLSLLFFGTLNSNGYLLLFILCVSLLLFSQLFVRPPQTTILPFCISFSLGWFWSPPSVQCYKPPFIVLQALSTRSNPLNLFVTSTV